MSLTLANYPLTVEDLPGEVYGFVEKNINPEAYFPWLRRAFPGWGYASLTWPTGYRRERDFVINKFYWPTGACRWAYGHFLADAYWTDKIRDAAFTSTGAGPSVPIRLKMDSPGAENDETLDTKVYLLPPSPLSAVPVDEENHTVNNLYLLTVVDERYYWWYKATPLLQFDQTNGETWINAFQKVSDSLGTTVQVDTISSSYLRASPQLNMSYEVLPPWFDALAFNVGQKVVRLYDGTVKTQNFSTAYTALLNDVNSIPHLTRTLIAGGDRFTDTII
jgi:hypothetical protein